MNTCFRLFCVFACCMFGLEPASAQIFTAPLSQNFGSLSCTSGIITTTLAIQNTGVSTLILSGGAVSPTNADFTIVSPANISQATPIFITPGVTQAIVIAYNPSRIGNITASLVFASNAVNASGGINSVALSAQRDSTGFVLSTTNIALNNVAINTPTTTIVTLQNTGTLPLSFVTPIFSGAFAIDSLVPAVVAPNTQARVFVRFFGAPSGVTTATTFALSDACGRVTQLRTFVSVQAQPTITNVSPTIGTAGTPVTITGTNLGNTQSILFGGVQAQSFSIVSTTQVIAIVGQGASGIVNVSVGGIVATAPQSFTFVAQPSALFVSPQSGGSGTVVTIIGTNLNNVNSVSFGGAPASFTINSPTQLTAVVGNGASGVITLTTLVGSTTSTQRFTFIPPPNVLFLTPQSGTAGTMVTIVGTNLDSTRNVTFGGVSAQSFTQVSPTQLSALVGMNGATGTVSVTTPGGISLSQQIFTFVAPPVITFISPATGGTGTIVNIIGTNFTNVTGVNFGGAPAQNFIVSSPSQIIATVGNGSSGAITVTTQTGSTSATQQFIFTAPPVITFFSPSMGGAGTAVNIFGSFFSNVTGVTFGGIPARSFTVISPTQIQAVVGQGASGSVAVIAQGGVGFSGSQFMFTPTGVRTGSNTTLEVLPNPVSTSALLRYTLRSTQAVKLSIFSMLGEHIITFDEGVQTAGTHTLHWWVEGIAQGMYTCRLHTGQDTHTLLLQVLK